MATTTEQGWSEERAIRAERALERGAATQPIVLGAGCAITLDAARGSVLRVLMGEVWVTETGATGDHVLRPGMCLRASGAGPLVIEAWTDSRLALDAPAVVGACVAAPVLPALRRIADWIETGWRRAVGFL